MKKYVLAGAAALFLSTIGVQAGTNSWALVSATGRVVEGLNVVHVIHPNAGHYFVRFSDDVSQCALSATPSGKANEPGEALVWVPKDRGTDVHVWTFRSNGNQPADYGFYLVALCL